MLMNMRIIICFLSFFLLFDEFIPTLSQSENVLIDFAIKRIKEAIEMSLSDTDERDSMAGIYLSMVDCLLNNQTIVCNTEKPYLRNCMRPVQEMLEKKGGTDEGLAKMTIDGIISAKDFICNAKVMEILEIFNPCLQSNLEPLFSCWGDTLTKLENDTDIKNLKEEYCKAFENNMICSLEEFTSRCESPTTRSVISNMYGAFFIQPCME